jgi:protein-tyrosine phosphatase
MTEVTYARTFALKGCINFRDLGGYQTEDGRRVRWRRLFRSDALHQMLEEDIDLLSAADVRLVSGLDLRSPLELQNTGMGAVFARGARHHHLPLLEVVSQDRIARQTATGQMRRPAYIDMLESAGPRIGALFGILADADTYPGVFYCAAGKDRTGIIAALILRALGITDEQIIHDYSLTEPMPVERREARLKELGWISMPVDIDPQLLVAAPETMEAFLVALDERYGGVEAYLASCGVAGETLESVREHLLE